MRDGQEEIKLKRGCPLTGGGPITMTRTGFERCCAAKKEAATEAADIDEHRSNSAVSVGFKYPCLSCSGPPPELKIIDIATYQQSQKKDKTMSTVNNTLGDLNSKLFAQLDRLADEKLSGDALAAEINRAKAVTDIACQIISVGSLALKAKVAFRNGNEVGGNIPKMLEG